MVSRAGGCIASFTNFTTYHFLTNIGPGYNEITLFTTSFSTLKDYRRIEKGYLKYSLNEIIFLTLSAVISGFTTYELISEFGKYELEWLRKFFPYKKKRLHTILWVNFIQN